MAFDVDTELVKQDERMRRAVPMGSAERAADAARSRRRQRAVARIGAKATRMAAAVAALVTALIAWALVVGPIGTTGLMLAVLLGIAMVVLLGIYPRAGDPPVTALATAPPAALPAKTEAWLDARRASLPRLAAPQVDAIAARLETLKPQLAAVATADPVAADLNRLLGKHLPELVESYTRVPPDQRARAIDDSGVSIEKKLVDGLAVVESELARVSDKLAAGDRDAFLIQGRFLESRYGKEELG